MANEEIMSWFLPAMMQAVKSAENDPTGKMGIRSIDTSNPSNVLRNSVMNNYQRWTSGQTPAPWIQERPLKFVDFMQKRWAPIGAENDPKNLNANWAPNVRYFLKQILGEKKYKEAEKLNLVKNQYPFPAMDEMGATT